MKTLGCASFVYNAIEQDYNFRETIACMQELADHVIVLDAGSTDGTQEHLLKLGDKKTTIILCAPEEWRNQQGKEKLSYFSNMAISRLETDYQFYLQMDEIIHEDSFPLIREAIEYGFESYMVKRHNLFYDPWHQLNVPQERKPCSTEVLRLAKTKYRCYDDAESLACNEVCFNFMENIHIFHMGYVRDPKKHLVKIRHMINEVFRLEPERRIEGIEEFDPSRFFATEDVIPIQSDLPKFIKEWVKERYPNGPRSL